MSFDFLRRVLTGARHPLLYPGELRSNCPFDARVLWVDTKPGDQCARIFIVSEHFPELALDEETPELIVEFTVGAGDPPVEAGNFP